MNADVLAENFFEWANSQGLSIRVDQKQTTFFHPDGRTENVDTHFEATLLAPVAIEGETVSEVRSDGGVGQDNAIANLARLVSNGLVSKSPGWGKIPIFG